MVGKQKSKKGREETLNGIGWRKAMDRKLYEERRFRKERVREKNERNQYEKMREGKEMAKINRRGKNYF